MDDIVYNLFNERYGFLASFTDLYLLKSYLPTDDQVAWVAIMRLNVVPVSVPMWEPEDFMKHYPHS